MIGWLNILVPSRWWNSFEDVPLEAQACGTPVIAFGKGGALETVRGRDHKSPTGLFFFEQTVPALIEAVERFETQNFIPSVCRENALRFAPERFREELKTVIEKELLLFRDGLAYELMVQRITRPHLCGKPCYIQVEQSARNKTMTSRRESYKYRRWFMMVPDQWRVPQQDGQ